MNLILYQRQSHCYEEHVAGFQLNNDQKDFVVQGNLGKSFLILKLGVLFFCMRGGGSQGGLGSSQMIQYVE